MESCIAELWDNKEFVLALSAAVARGEDLFVLLREENEVADMFVVPREELLEALLRYGHPEAAESLSVQAKETGIVVQVGEAWTDDCKVLAFEEWTASRKRPAALLN